MRKIAETYPTLRPVEIVNGVATISLNNGGALSFQAPASARTGLVEISQPDENSDTIVVHKFLNTIGGY